MNRLAAILPAADVVVDVDATSKKRVFEHAGLLFENQHAIARATVTDNLFARERLGSTGLGHGVAIPHGKIEGLARIYCMFARLSDPVDYKAIDGQPVDLIFLLLSPPDAGAEHLKALAAISRVTRHAPTLEKMRGARSRDALAAVLMGADERDAA